MKHPHRWYYQAQIENLQLTQQVILTTLRICSKYKGIEKYHGSTLGLETR